ncbi:hypothetical protein [Thermococcus sp. 21S7]|uniref:hypothetical protein n=1 Tax=Thermococcus sp. 21S7 TaxID=1638221 RepID=UPI00143A82F6|nr:hypothetical protein [Thermococcus sp. 21S7]NJE61524.1 hypothetical protein [Thermococcus sp. 21S7]
MEAMRRKLFGFIIPWFTAGLLILEDYLNLPWFFRKRVCLGITDVEWSLRCHDFFDLLFLALPLVAVALVTWLLRRRWNADGLSLFTSTVVLGVPGILALFIIIAVAVSKRLPTGIGEEFTIFVLFVYLMTLVGVAAGALAPRHVPVDDEAHGE